MTDPVKEPQGLRFRAGGGFGLPSLKRDVDVTPYGTFYRQTEVIVQVERRQPDAKLTLFSRDWPIYLNAGFGQSDISGSYQNLGSNRQLYYVSGGGRFYFPDPMFIEGNAGFGGARNQLDFGKGFPVETLLSANLLLRGGLGVEHCMAETICFSAAAYWHLDASFLGGTPYIVQGPLVMIMAGGRRDTVVYDMRTVKIYKDEIERLEERNTETVQKCRDEIDTLKIDVMKKEDEVERCIDAAAKECVVVKQSAGPVVIKVPHGNEDAEKRALLSSLYVYFANDNPDQVLQFNWFPAGKDGSRRRRVSSVPDGHDQRR